MAIFQGLRVHIVHGDKYTNVEPKSLCEEYETAACYDMTVGLTSHQFISLPPDDCFGIKVSVDDSFRWEDSNALCLQIDFDDCSTIGNAEVYLTRTADVSISSAQTLKHNVLDHVQESFVYKVIQLTNAPAQIEQSLRFTTAPLSETRSKSTTDLSRFGQIVIAVGRCTLTKRADQQRLIKCISKSQPDAAKLQERGIYTKIE